MAILFALAYVGLAAAQAVPVAPPWIQSCAPAAKSRLRSVRSAGGGRYCIRFATQYTIPAQPQVWDAQRERLLTLDGYWDEVERSVDSKGLLLAGCKDGRARVWSLESGALVASFEVGGSFRAAAVGFFPGNRMVGIASENKVFRVWEISSGKLLQELNATDWVSSFAVSPDQRLLALGLRYGRIAVWDWSAGTMLRQWQAHDGTIDNVDSGGTESVEFSPDGRMLRSYGYIKGASKAELERGLVWEVGTGRRLAAKEWPPAK